MVAEEGGAAPREGALLRREGAEELAHRRACLEALKQSGPATIHSRSTEAHNQDKVSMGTIAARDARTIAELASNIAAIHAIAVCQALELRGVEAASAPARAAYGRLRGDVAFLDRDRRLDADIERGSARLGPQPVEIRKRRGTAVPADAR